MRRLLIECPKVPSASCPAVQLLYDHPCTHKTPKWVYIIGLISVYDARLALTKVLGESPHAGPRTPLARSFSRVWLETKLQLKTAESDAKVLLYRSFRRTSWWYLFMLFFIIRRRGGDVLRHLATIANTWSIIFDHLEIWRVSSFRPLVCCPCSFILVSHFTLTFALISTHFTFC